VNCHLHDPVALSVDDVLRELERAALHQAQNLREGCIPKSVRLKAIVGFNALRWTKAAPAGSGLRRRGRVLGRLGSSRRTVAAVATLNGAREDA
jgi:acyl dehydratase